MSNFEGEEDDYPSLVAKSGADLTHEQELERRSRARASLKARAAETNLDLTNKDQRMSFIVDMLAEGLWEKGYSTETMAEEWKMHPGSLARDVSDCIRILRLASDKGEAIKLFYAETIKQVEAARETREFTREKIRLTSSADADKLSSSDIRNLADASNKAAAMADKPLEMLGRASGVLSTGSVGATTNVLVQQISESPEVTRPMLHLVEILKRELPPELLRRVLEEFRMGVEG